MAYFSYTGLAVICTIAFTICGASPRPGTVKGRSNMNTAMDAGYLKIPLWLSSEMTYVKQLVPNNNIQEYAETDKQQDSTIKAADDSLPVLIHKKDEESGIKNTPVSFSYVDKVHPFVRSKRSTCTTPANLPQMVIDLNKRLTSSQFVGLNPGESTPPTAPASQPKACPTSTAGDWWPRSEVNLRSTCPWNLQQVDLGEDAFPRYVNNAVPLCEFCTGYPTMTCKELEYNMTYFVRKGCENGLAVMETQQKIVVLGYHCVAGVRQTMISDHTGEE